MKHKPTIWRTEINTARMQRLGDKAAQEGTLLDDFTWGETHHVEPSGRHLPEVCRAAVERKDTALRQSHPPEPFHRPLSIQS